MYKQSCKHSKVRVYWPIVTEVRDLRCSQRMSELYVFLHAFSTLKSSVFFIKFNSIGEGTLVRPETHLTRNFPYCYTLKTPGSDLTRKGSLDARPISGSDPTRKPGQTDPESESERNLLTQISCQFDPDSGSVWPRNESGQMGPFPGQIWPGGL